MTRVQIPAFTDAWMRGDRYGEIVKVTNSYRNKTSQYIGDTQDIAHVLLDKSGKTVRVILADCEVI